MPRPHAVALNPEREVTDEADGLTGAAGVSLLPAPVDECPFGGSPTVVVCGLADELELDFAVDALDSSHEHVVAVVVGRWPRVRRDRVFVIARADRQRVANHDPAPGCLPRRLGVVLGAGVLGLHLIGDRAKVRLQAGFVARHSAVLPQQLAELAME